jgi:hypothetical protein
MERQTKLQVPSTLTVRVREQAIATPYSEQQNYLLQKLHLLENEKLELDLLTSITKD